MQPRAFRKFAHVASHAVWERSNDGALERLCHQRVRQASLQRCLLDRELDVPIDDAAVANHSGGTSFHSLAHCKRIWEHSARGHAHACAYAILWDTGRRRNIPRDRICDAFF